MRLRGAGVTYNPDMKRQYLDRCPGGRFGLGSGFIAAVALVAAGLSAPGRGTAAAQAPGPCGLLTTAEIQPLAPNATIGAGVAVSVDASGLGTCRYTWGTGAGRFKLDVTVNDASRMYSSMAADLIKQRLNGSVTPETADAVVSGVGDAAVFRADSAVYVHATAYSKGRVLQVQLDGFEAREMKDQVIALLKSAASRL